MFADIKRRVSGLARWSIEDLTRLYPGQALWLSQQSCVPELRGVAELVYLRPPACAHGGHTRAVL